MKVTSVEAIKIVGRHPNEIGVCRILLDDELILHSVKLIKSKNGGYSLQMPRSPFKKGKRVARNGSIHNYDVFHPTTKEFYEYLLEEVIEAFEKLED